MPNKKNTIKRVSINLFYKKGYFATGMSEIARAAKIQKASIYYHYENKEEILFDILKTALIDLDANMERHVKTAKNTEEKMRTAILSHVIFHIDRQKEVLISDSELRGLTANNYKNIIEMRNNYEQKFQSILKKGIKEKIFSNLDFKVISYGILTLCTAVSIWFRPSGRLSKEAVAQIYTDFILNGLKS